MIQDHIQEIIDRWLAIDDEIWAKIICMEKNRRIAKAYARRQSLTVNGSEEEYLDGTTLGLNSFDNPDRSSKTTCIKQYIGQVSSSFIVAVVSTIRSDPILSYPILSLLFPFDTRQR